MVFRFRTILTGFSGAPGVNTFHATGPGPISAQDIDDFSDQLQSMYDALSSRLVEGLTIRIDPAVQEFNDESGTLIAVHSISEPWVEAGGPAGSGNLSRATMIKCRFYTDAVVGQRLLRGGIYLGPIGEAAMADNGGIVGTVATEVATAFAGMLDILGPLRLAVWHQPKDGAGGVVGHVQSVGIMGVPAVLRGRRD